MEKKGLVSQLSKRVHECWDAYVDDLLKQAPSVLISRAEEIAAASFCCDQLTGCAGSYSEELLEHLLRFDDPLKAMREQWMQEKDADPGEEFERAMWELREYGPEPESGPAIGGMT